VVYPADQGPKMSSAGTNQRAGDRTYRTLRSDILMGRLLPGQKLRLDELRKSYGASVSTLRELLSRLSSERLVLAEGQKGFEVAPVSISDLREIAELRMLLEVNALKDSIANGDLEWESRVLASHHKLAAIEAKRLAGDKDDTESWKRYDWQFHQALISACGSKRLMDAHAAVFDKYLRYQMLALSDRGEIAVREHEQLLACALNRDADAAVQVLRKHVAGGVAHAIANGTIPPDNRGCT